MSYQAEYIWIDGTEPSPLLRSKTRIVADGKEPGIWGFDGSSTNQAPGDDSDCVLRPVFTCPDPLRGPDDKLVMCEVLLTDFTPHPTNTRAACAAAAEKYADQEPWFGIEQEYTFLEGGRPLGWPAQGFPAPQGPYYCGVGGDKMPGRDIVERHTVACMDAGLAIEGTNAEVMMGQWEFQIGVLPPPAIGGPALGGPVAALPHRRGLRGLRHPGAQARPRRLERRRGPHQLLHQGHAGGRRLGRHHRRLRSSREERRGAREATTASASPSA